MEESILEEEPSLEQKLGYCKTLRAPHEIKWSVYTRKFHSLCTYPQDGNFHKLMAKKVLVITSQITVSILNKKNINIITKSNSLKQGLVWSSSFYDQISDPSGKPLTTFFPVVPKKRNYFNSHKTVAEKKSVETLSVGSITQQYSIPVVRLLWEYCAPLPAYLHIYLRDNLYFLVLHYTMP